MENFIPITYFDYYGIDGYYYKAVVVKNPNDSTCEELHDHLVHKQVQVGNSVLEVDSIEYEHFDVNHDFVREVKKNEPLVLIVRNKQSLISLRARLHPKMVRLIRKYRHNSVSSAKVMIYGALIMGFLFFLVFIVLGSVLRYLYIN